MLSKNKKGSNVNDDIKNTQNNDTDDKTIGNNNENEKEHEQNNKNTTDNKNVINDNASSNTQCTCTKTCCEYKSLYEQINSKVFAYVEKINYLTNSNKYMLNTQAKEKEEMKRNVISSVISTIINLHNTVINAQNSVENLKHNGDENNIINNILSVILTQIDMILKEYKVRQISPQKGDKFNANLHNIINVEKANDSEMINTIANVISVGYYLAAKDSENDNENVDMLIQPAAVIVYVT